MTEETTPTATILEGSNPTDTGETLEGFSISPLAKTLLFFVGGAACGVLIGLAIATLTREPPTDFVAPPKSGAFITGDDLLEALGIDEPEENQ